MQLEDGSSTFKAIYNSACSDSENLVKDVESRFDDQLKSCVSYKEEYQSMMATLFNDNSKFNEVNDYLNYINVDGHCLIVCTFRV